MHCWRIMGCCAVHRVLWTFPHALPGRHRAGCERGRHGIPVRTVLDSKGLVVAGAPWGSCVHHGAGRTTAAPGWQLVGSWRDDVA